MAELGFDPDALRARYREERDKRLRADGNEQCAVFHVVSSRFDPEPRHADLRGVCAGNARNSKPTLTRVVTIGGGLGNWEATHRQYGLTSGDAQ
jgi:cyclohexanone monooxygenase